MIITLFVNKKYDAASSSSQKLLAIQTYCIFLHILARINFAYLRTDCLTIQSEGRYATLIHAKNPIKLGDMNAASLKYINQSVRSISSAFGKFPGHTNGPEL